MELKRADNFVLFGEETIPETSVDLFQVRADWFGRGPLWSGQATAYASLVFSPGGIGAYNSREDFALFRNDSDPTYLYARLGGQWERPLANDWALNLRGTAQLASGALIPTEQLGLGGHDTIRGYEERILLADSGYSFSTEIHTPSFHFGNGLLENSSLHALAFLDHGLGWREGEGTQSLTSLGLGLRLQVDDTATIRLDFGQALTSSNDLAVHGGLFFSF
jgi:hemolysin activation/secretion protein